MKPLISVLVDTYNQERYIEQAIVSVLEQDFPSDDYEIVVVDDGSTDRTPEIIRKFAPRVRILRKENGGQASSFNAAVPELRGEIIAFLDGDDWFAPAKLSAVWEEFEKNPQAGGVAHGYYEFHEDSKETKIRAPESHNFLNLTTAVAASDALAWWQFLVVGSLTVRRQVLRQLLPISEELIFCADGPIVWAAIAAGVTVFEQPLCYYRHHPSNLHAVNDQDIARVRPKLRMNYLMIEAIEKLLSRLDVNEEALMVLYARWMDGYRYYMELLEEIDPEAALRAVNRFLRLSEYVEVSRWEIAETWLRAARIEYRLGRPGRALLSAGHGFLTRPMVAGRPIKSAFSRIAAALKS
jgi:glycosyltransferase involved in cell wall biosynthesis